MNKIDFAKISKKEDMIMVFNQLKDDYSIAFQQIQELTNNWDELEQWCKNNLGYYGSDIGIIYKYVLDKMKEIKGKNDNI